MIVQTHTTLIAYVTETSTVIVQSLQCREKVNSEKSLGNLFNVKTAEHVQGCKLKYTFLTILTVFIQNLETFDPLTEKLNNNTAYERILPACKN